MKNIKTDEIEINISVIGLSGSEKTKGVKGIGKSCLCNRLAQPNFYKSKHSSIISSFDLLASTIQNNQWIYWGGVNRDIKGKRYLFKFIEQTIMIEEVSHRPLISIDDYLTRATTIELRGTKNIHIVGSQRPPSTTLNEKTDVHIFLLLYDVSVVEGRNPDTQDTIFKQLFDRVVSTKRPLIVVATKHDQASLPIVDRLTSILAKRPYCKYPVVEISSSSGINFDCLFDLATLLSNGGLRVLKERLFTYKDAFEKHKVQLEQCSEELKHVAMNILDSELWHSSWNDLKRVPAVDIWVARLGSDVVCSTFEEVRLDARLKRRVHIQCKHKEVFIKLLSQFRHLLPSKYKEIASVIEMLKEDSVFMKHFVSFDLNAEYFVFDETAALLPLYILDENNENNLIFAIKEFLDQRTLEDQLFQHLAVDCPGNFRKSRKDIEVELKHHAKHFIPEKTISNVYERFRQHYLNMLECQFLEIIHENPNLFWSLGILRVIDTTVEESAKTNGFSRNKLHNEGHHDSSPFLATVSSEINSKIDFPPLSIVEDDKKIRERWICRYLEFLLSANGSPCTYRDLAKLSCSSAQMTAAESWTSLKEETDLADLPHVWYIVVVGHGLMKNKLIELILSSQNKMILEICKVHSTKYEVKLVSSVEMLKDVASDLYQKGNKCCGLCALVCAGDDVSVEMDLEKVTLLERSCNCVVVKYVVHKVVEELVEVGPFERSLSDSQDLTNNIHISILISNCIRLNDPSVVWVVTVCGDSYDFNALISFIVNVLKLHSIPRRINSDFMTISGCFTSKEVERQNYRLCFMPYHQAIKLLMRNPSPPSMDGLLLVCSLERLASLNTCLGIRKYLRKESKLSCSSLMLAIRGNKSTLLDQALQKSHKLGMNCIPISVENPTNILSTVDHEVEDQLLDFFKNTFKGFPIYESIDDTSSNASSLRLRAETSRNEQIDSSNQLICKTCGQSKSHENVNNSVRLSQSSHDGMYEIISYDPILGDMNETLFDPCIPEYQFQGAVDGCSNCTEIKCSQHQPTDWNGNNLQSFRTRIRSQSGPDLRNFSDSNKSTLKKSNSSITHCVTCGAKISHSNDDSGSRKSFFQKFSSEKEGHVRNFAGRLQDLFIKKPNESQTREQRRLLVRTSSKRRK